MIAFIAALLSTASVLAAYTTTQVVIVQPWSQGQLKSSMRVTERRTGNCWGNSLVSDRRTAWRCMAGNDIYDPCFSDPQRPRTVACVAGPFSNNVALMTLTKALPGSPDAVDTIGELHNLRLRGQPWGLQLTDGETCTFMTGATDVVHGERLNYACTKRFAIGLPYRSSSAWEIKTVPGLHGNVESFGVAEAVF